MNIECSTVVECNYKTGLRLGTVLTQNQFSEQFTPAVFSKKCVSIKRCSYPLKLGARLMHFIRIKKIKETNPHRNDRVHAKKML